MIALDAVEQLHAAPLHPEHADAIADLRPFGVEIGVDEIVATASRTWSVALSAWLQSTSPPRASATALVSCIAWPEKSAQMLARPHRGRAACRTARAVDADNAESLPITQSPGARADRSALASASSSARLGRVAVMRALDRRFVDARRRDLELDPRLRRACPADRA